MAWDNYANKPLIPIIQVDPSVAFDAAIAPYNVMFSDPNPDIELLPWYNSTTDIVRNLPLQDPRQKEAIQKFCDALLNQNMGNVNMSDLQGIDPTIIRLATAGVGKIRRQRTGDPSGISRSMAVCESLRNNLIKAGGGEGSRGGSKTDGKGDEKDSAASIRGAEIARRLKEKEDGDKASNKDCKVNKAIEMLRGNLAKAGEGSRGGKIMGHTKSGKAIYSTEHAMYHGAIPSEVTKKVASHTKGWSSKDHDEAAAMHKENSGDNRQPSHRGPTAVQAHEKLSDKRFSQGK